jgi:dihydroflavonol-4-reductase
MECHRARASGVLPGRFLLWPRGGTPIVDVRDVAAVAAVLTAGRGPRRYIVPGHHVDVDQLFTTLADITGRRLPHLILLGPVSGASSRLIDAVQRILPERWHYPADHEGAEPVRRDTRFDDSAARKALGSSPDRSSRPSLTRHPAPVLRHDGYVGGPERLLVAATVFH